MPDDAFDEGFDERLDHTLDQAFDDTIDASVDDEIDEASVSDDHGGPPRRSLLPPEDRVWRHPSEISPASSASTSTSWSGSWGTAAFSAVGGALAVGVLWLTVGQDGAGVAVERVSLVPIQTIAPVEVEPEDWGATVTAHARGGTAEVVTSADRTAVAGAVTYRDDGYMITSARAVEGLETLYVLTADGVTRQATTVGADQVTDVSVLRTDPFTDPAVVAEHPGVESGDKVAIVDPGGDSVESTVVDPLGQASTSDGDVVLGVIRLDTELGDVPPGSPVVDATGAVVGITASTDTTAGAALVPIDVARDVAADLIEDGVATHAWLGVTARTFEGDDDSPAGVLVTSLSSGGPADTGTVMTGDIIVSVDGIATESVGAMVSVLRVHEPGDSVSITVDRDGEAVGCSVELGVLEGAAG